VGSGLVDTYHKRRFSAVQFQLQISLAALPAEQRSFIAWESV